MLNSIGGWLTDPAHWTGPNGIPQRILEHLIYSGISLVIAALIAIPLGVMVGHSGRAKWTVSLANSLRAVPSLGLLFAVALWLGPKIASSLAYVIPSVIVLVLLAVPPILSGTYAGIQGVDPAARDAAKGMGMRGSEVLRKVELPCSLPLLLSGVRSATLQVIATATIAASISLGGLGRYLIDGLSVSDYAEMASGAILVAALALVMDGLLSIVQRTAVSPGLTGKFRNTGTTGRLSPLRPEAMPRIPPLPPTVPTTREKHSYEAHDPHDRGGRCRGARPRRLRRQQQPHRPRGRWWRSTASAAGVAASPWARPTSPSPRCSARSTPAPSRPRASTVTTKPNIGSRDVYIKALQDGSIDIVPEYTGSLLTFLKGTAPSQDPDAVYTALKATLPPTLVVLDKSTARGQELHRRHEGHAEKYSLKSIADLTAHQADITVAAPRRSSRRVSRGWSG